MYKITEVTVPVLLLFFLTFLTPVHWALWHSQFQQ